MTFLTGSVPARVFAEAVAGASASEIRDDQVFITLRHANGSISNIAYLAGGDRAFPKERVEVFGGGRVGVIEDFRRVITCAGGRVRKSRKQGKGHREELEVFLRACRERGAWPIPRPELRAVSLASIPAVRRLREGAPLPIPGEVDEP